MGGDCKLPEHLKTTLPYLLHFPTTCILIDSSRNAQCPISISIGKAIPAVVFHAFEFHQPLCHLSRVVIPLALPPQTIFNNHSETSLSGSERIKSSHFDDVEDGNRAARRQLGELGNTLHSGRGSIYKYSGGTQILPAKPIHFMTGRHHLRSKQGRGLDLQQL